jgi:hypothetical protein
MVEHRTTLNTMAVNCKACRTCLPQVRAAREDAQARGSAVVEALAQLGISASYENRNFPTVELGLAEAEKLAILAVAAQTGLPFLSNVSALTEALDAAFQRGVHAGQESAC